MDRKCNHQTGRQRQSSSPAQESPDWPQPAQPGGCYRIEITGEPSYAVDVCLSSPNGDHNHAGLVATAMRVVNAIPAVVGAPAGIRTTLDLPLITGRGLYSVT